MWDNSTLFLWALLSFIVISCILENNCRQKHDNQMILESLLFAKCNIFIDMKVFRYTFYLILRLILQVKEIYKIQVINVINSLHPKNFFITYSMKAYNHFWWAWNIFSLGTLFWACTHFSQKSRPCMTRTFIWRLILTSLVSYKFQACFRCNKTHA